MCGITGLFVPGQGLDEGCLISMTDSLIHRGPDDSSLWVDQAAGIGLGHRRLAILDLSPKGRQPMVSQSGRYVICYNGEVYNHLDIRRELIGYPFVSTSDTETILAAIEHWGVAKSLEKFIGMFAIALWDRQERQLVLVRDRMGIKPLYYASLPGGGWVFGSELKALRLHHAFSRSIDRDALTLFFRHNYIPAPHTIYKDTWKLLPGEMAVIDCGGLRKEIWWDVDQIWRSGADRPLDLGDVQAIDELESLLSDAVGLRMLSDVPLGVFLSGGIDSSTVAALMQAQSSRPVKSFSIGFHESQYNEAQLARAVSDHLGTDHTELYVTPRDLLDIVPLISRYWDEPFADSSQIPTYLLSRLTRGHVTVSLSGDGGDELFCGYERYFWTHRVYSALTRVPWALRRMLAALGKAAPKSWFGLLGGKGQRIRWRLDALTIDDLGELYRYFISHFKNPALFVLGAEEPQARRLTAMGDSWSWMALHDLQTYLPDDILTKVDRASMAVSLEARVPLLDHRVVAFASRVPHVMKVRDGQSKWLLRQVLYRHVPPELVDRPKIGFGVPIRRWMRGELREWCEALLSYETIKRQGYIDADAVRGMWRAYLAGEDNWNYYLWDVLMFQSWLESECYDVL